MSKTKLVFPVMLVCMLALIFASVGCSSDGGGGGGGGGYLVINDIPAIYNNSYYAYFDSDTTGFGDPGIYGMTSYIYKPPFSFDMTMPPISDETVSLPTWIGVLGDPIVRFSGDKTVRGKVKILGSPSADYQVNSPTESGSLIALPSQAVMRRYPGTLGIHSSAL